MRASFEVACDRVRGQGRPRFAGHAYETEQERDWKRLIASEYGAQCPGVKFPGPVAVRIDVMAKQPEGQRAPSPNTGTPDVRDIADAVLDALNGVAYEDDAQVVELTVKKWNRTRRDTELMRVSVWEA